MNVLLKFRYLSLTGLVLLPLAIVQYNETYDPVEGTYEAGWGIAIWIGAACVLIGWFGGLYRHGGWPALGLFALGCLGPKGWLVAAFLVIKYGFPMRKRPRPKTERLLVYAQRPAPPRPSSYDEESRPGIAAANGRWP